MKQTQGDPSGFDKLASQQSDSSNLIIFDIINLAMIRPFIVNEKTIELIEYQASKRRTALVGNALISSPLHSPSKSKLSRLLKARIIDRPKTRKRTATDRIESIFKSFRKGKARETELMMPKGLSLKRMGFTTSSSTVEMSETLIDYVPIIFFLVVALKQHDQALKLLFYDQWLMMFDTKVPEDLICSEEYLFVLVRHILIYKEHKVFDLLLQTTNCWETLFSEEIIDLYLQENRIDYMKKFIDKFNSYLYRNQRNVRSGESGTGASTNTAALASPVNKGGSSRDLNDEELSHSIISKDKILMIIEKYFENIDENKYLLALLTNIGYTSKEIVDFFMLSNEEDRVFTIISQSKRLSKVLEPNKIVEQKMYKLLLIIDPVELINVFNLNSDPKRLHSVSLYTKMCNSIKEGQKIQSLCFVLMHVNVTFWDYDKFWKFYQSLNEVLRYEHKRSWLASVDNPLLFCIKLAYFFKKINRMLDINSKEIRKLCNDLVDFCICYVNNSSEDNLILNFFDKDKEGFDFLDYAFKVKHIEIFNLEFLTKTILNMWDLGRQSKQSFKEYFQISNFVNETDLCSIQVFKKNYKAPIESTDVFQQDFYLTSRSILLKVLSDIIWLYTLVGFEFTFSMFLVQLYMKGETFDSSFAWIIHYYDAHPWFFFIHCLLRVNYILNILARLAVFRSIKAKSFHLRYFYYLILLLYIVQMLIYPLWASGNIWILNNCQMLIVASLIMYSLYLALSLDWIGVILRIFARMTYVVFIFGITTIVIISIVAFPIHICFIKFTQRVDGGPNSELNMFRDFYNGILTIFEFTFGAVVLVRPYVEQNIYTYSMTFVMIIVSFFGNIMLANMLVAFLASQFDKISDKAKYYTLRMQLTLARTLHIPDLDTVITLPYFLTAIFGPVYMLLMCKGKTRSNINRFLKRTVQIINVALPSTIYYLVYLLLLIIYSYFAALFNVVLIICKQPLKILYLPIWILVGPFFFLKLLIQDICFATGRMLEFKDVNDGHLFDIKLEDSEKVNLGAAFEMVYIVAVRLVKTEQLSTISLNKFLWEIRQSFPDVFQTRGSANADPDETEASIELNETLLNDQIPNRMKHLFKCKYDINAGKKLFRTLLKKFVSYSERVSSKNASSMEIDLIFLIEKCKNNLGADSIQVLVSFDKLNIELALKEMRAGEKEAVLKKEVNAIKSKLDNLGRDIKNLAKFMGKMDQKVIKLPMELS